VSLLYGALNRYAASKKQAIGVALPHSANQSWRLRALFSRAEGVSERGNKAAMA
jgi:hypothetical protein